MALPSSTTLPLADVDQLEGGIELVDLAGRVAGDLTSWWVTLSLMVMSSLYLDGAASPPPVLAKISSLRSFCPTRPGIGVDLDGRHDLGELGRLRRGPAVERLEAAAGKRRAARPQQRSARAGLRHHIDDPLRHDHHLLDFTSPNGAHDIVEL